MIEKKPKKEAPKPGWYVYIKEHNTNKKVSTFGPVHSERSAERLERGVNINLNHEKFFTDVKEVKAKS